MPYPPAGRCCAPTSPSRLSTGLELRTYASPGEVARDGGQAQHKRSVRRVPGAGLEPARLAAAAFKAAVSAVPPPGRVSATPSDATVAVGPRPAHPDGVPHRC